MQWGVEQDGQWRMEFNNDDGSEISIRTAVREIKTVKAG